MPNYDLTAWTASRNDKRGLTDFVAPASHALLRVADTGEITPRGDLDRLTIAERAELPNLFRAIVAILDGDTDTTVTGVPPTPIGAVESSATPQTVVGSLPEDAPSPVVKTTNSNTFANRQARMSSAPATAEAAPPPVEPKTEG